MVLTSGVDCRSCCLWNLDYGMQEGNQCCEEHCDRSVQSGCGSGACSSQCGTSGGEEGALVGCLEGSIVKYLIPRASGLTDGTLRSSSEGLH